VLRKQIMAVIAAVAVAASAFIGAPTATAASDKVLNWGSAVDVTTPWEPYAMSDGHFRPIMALAYESLLKVRTDGKTIDPGLATKWVWKGNKALVLTLRSGVKFSDGTALDAAAVKANLDRVLVNKYAGPRTGALNNVSDVAVVNPTTVQVNLKQPDSLLPLWLSLNMGYMVSPKAIASADKTGNLADLLTATDGTGPYVLNWGASVKGSKYTFDRNPGYWQKGAALTKAFPFDQIVVKVYTNATARANALRSGDIDIALVGAFDMPAVDKAGFQVITENLDVIALRLTDRNGENVKALGDLRVRQALNYAINRDQFGAFGVGTSQSFTKGLDAYNPKWDDFYRRNPRCCPSSSLLCARLRAVMNCQPLLSVLCERPARSFGSVLDRYACGEQTVADRIGRCEILVRARRLSVVQRSAHERVDDMMQVLAAGTARDPRFGKGIHTEHPEHAAHITQHNAQFVLASACEQAIAISDTLVQHGNRSRNAEVVVHGSRKPGRNLLGNDVAHLLGCA